MTINELAKKINGELLAIPDPEAEVKGGYCGDLPPLSCRGGGFCSWRLVYVLLRPVRHERRSGQPKRQPRPLCPALPPSLRLRCGGKKEISPEFERQLSCRQFR